jgi:O-antigen/teichoic acid export membrane protein
VARRRNDRRSLEHEVVQRADAHVANRTALTRRMATNTGVQALGAVLGALIGLATFIAIARELGPTTYGDLLAATVILFIAVALSDAAFAGILRELTQKPAEAERVLRASLPLRALVGVGILLVTLAVALAAPFTDDTKVALLIAAPGSLFTLFDLALLPAFQAQLRMQWPVIATLTGRALAMSLTFAVLAAGHGLEAVVLAATIGQAATFLIDLVAVSRIVSVRPVIDVGLWRSLVRGSFALGLSGALGLIWFRVDAVLLALLRNPREVGLYGAAYKFIELTETVASFASNSAFPTLSRLVDQADAQASRLVQRATDLLLAMAAPLTVLMLVYPEDLIRVTAGPEFVAAAGALQLLAPFVLFSFVGGLLWRTLVASRDDRLLLGLAVAMLVLNIALNIALIPPYGYTAAAVTTVVSQVAGTALAALAVRRTHGFWINLRYVPVLAAGVAAMTAVCLVLPGPVPLVAFAGLAAYVGVVAALPGAARRTLAELTAR